MRFQPHLQDGFEDREAMRRHAVQMRLDGFSRRDIAAALGFATGGKTLSDWLRGVPPPEWTKRPNAKDDLRDRAVAMRLEGMTYRDIRDFLGVSKSSLSLWLKDLLLTPEQKAAIADRAADAAARAAATNRARGAAARASEISKARDQVCELSESELFVAGVTLYWAEGAKEKPWGRSQQVQFINSDPKVVSLFLGFLQLIGVSRERLIFRLSIHETADVDRATEYWNELVRGSPSQWRKPSLKRHKAATSRMNVAEGYHGCLVVTVRKSASLCRQISGWFEGIVRASRLAQ